MTTYATGNPIGSTAVKDLYDNAQNLDLLMLGPQNQYNDRLGVPRISWAGIENQFAAFLIASGYEFIGDYTTNNPLTITRPNQVFSHAGEYWRAGPDLVLPYTTVNNWTTDQPKFVSVGDAVLRTQLASAGGAALVGGAVQYVTNFAALAGLTPVDGKIVTTLGYYTAGDGGSASYRWDAAGNAFVMMPYDRPSLRQFGAKCDAATDDSAAINAAFAAFGARGGVIKLPADGRCYIASDITVPANCHFEGPHHLAGSGKNNTFTGWAEIGGALVVNSAATIRVAGGASLTGCVIRRQGQVFPSYMPTGYAGIAVTITGDDACVEGNIMLGFNKALYSSGNQRMNVIANLFDCTNGIEITSNGDVGHVDCNHGWPFITTPHPNASFDPDTSYRAGTAYYFHDLCDFTLVTNNFQFGYSIGYDIYNASNITLTGNINDGFGDVGFRVREGCNGIRFIGGFAPTSDVGMQISCDGYNVKVLGVDFENNSTCAINCTAGNPVILGCHMMNTPNALYVSGIQSRIIFDGNSTTNISDVPVKFVALNYYTNIGDSNNWGDWPFATPPVSGTQGVPTIAAADPLVPPTFGKVIKVSGAAGNIGSMYGGFLNRRITLWFDGNNTIINGVANANSIRCPGNANINVVLGSSITLEHTGSYWKVVSVAL